MGHVALSSAAGKDLRRIGPGPDLDRIEEALAILSRDPPPPNLDVKPLVGRHPWRRPRVGPHPVVFRPLTPEETARLGRRGGVSHASGVLVDRVVHRRDLEAAARRLG